MQRRGFILLVGATVVLAAAAVVSLRTSERTVSRAEPGALALPNLAPKLDTLAWVRINRGKMKANFSQIGGRWSVVEKGNYPADEAKMRHLLLGLADLTLIEPKTERPELFPRLDLDDPSNGKSTQVVVQDRQGQIVGQLIIGRERPDRLGRGTDGVYVRRIGEERAWLARGSVDVSGDVLNWINPQIMDVPAGRIATVILVGANQGVLVVGRKAATDKFAVENASGNAKFKDDKAIAAPAAALERFDLVDVKPAADQPVPDSGVSTAAFTTLDGLTIRLKLFEADKRDWVVMEASGSGAVAAEAKAVNDRAGKWAFAISNEKAKLLRTNMADLVVPAGGS